jgi:outer membrane protein OmpA-like peptidoglycan-associated protein
MRVKSLIAFSAFVCCGSLSSMAGDAAYSPDDIVKFFSAQQATRALCVGTEEECGFADKKQMGFNLRLSFEKNSAVLKDDAKVNLTAFAQALKSPSLSVANFSIEGYTDAAGTDTYNKKLSERRAASVVAYLSGLGVDTAKLQARGFGETVPIGDDPFDPANRRVETRLVIQ